VVQVGLLLLPRTTGSSSSGLCLSLHKIDQRSDVLGIAVYVFPLEFWCICGRARVAASPADKDLAIVFGGFLDAGRIQLLETF
jgi:hypothetical protein